MQKIHFNLFAGTFIINLILLTYLIENIFNFHEMYNL